MYRNFITRKITPDEKLKIWVAPNLPAVKLGKALMSFTQIKSPGDVVAVHMDEGLFSSTIIIITDQKCFYDGGSFPLNEVKQVRLDGKKLIIGVNHQGLIKDQQLKFNDADVASVFERLFSSISNYSPELEQLKKEEKDYSQYSATELDWLNLRDEVMATIDLLYEKFNDGKLSLLEYEEAKAELLSRL